MAKKLRKFWTKEDRLFVTISETGDRKDYQKKEYAQEEDGLENKLTHLFREIIQYRIVVSERSNFSSEIESVRLAVGRRAHNIGKMEDLLYDEDGVAKTASIAAGFLTRMYLGGTPAREEEWSLFESELRAQNADTVAAYRKKYLEYRNKGILVIREALHSIFDGKGILVIREALHSIFDGYAAALDINNDVYLVPEDSVRGQVFVDNSEKSAVRVRSMAMRLTSEDIYTAVSAGTKPFWYTEEKRGNVLRTIVWEESGRIPSGLTYREFYTDEYGITEKL